MFIFFRAQQMMLLTGPMESNFTSLARKSMNRCGSVGVDTATLSFILNTSDIWRSLCHFSTNQKQLQMGLKILQ